MADESKQELAEDRTDYAEDRTKYAEDRTALANERTFAGWVRTAFAAIGIGIAFNALFKALEPEWVPKSIATIFLLIAIFIFVAAERRGCKVLSRLETHEVKQAGTTTLRVVTWASVVATIGLIVGIWTLA